MTERKPQGMGFRTWVDQTIADAERRGVFDDLPGKGKPLNLKPGAGGDFGEAWARDYARREGVSAEEFLPTPLRLRREIERLMETAGGFRSEQEIREVAADINRRIVEWRRIPVGPPIHVRLVNADDMAARWREARRAAAATGRTAAAGSTAAARGTAAATGPAATQPSLSSPPSPADPPTPPASPGAAAPGRLRWWRRRRSATPSR